MVAMSGGVDSSVAAALLRDAGHDVVGVTMKLWGGESDTGCCHLCFEDIESEALLFLLEEQGVLASAAASCASGAQDPSHVLAAIGVPRELARGSLRLSLGPTTTDDDVDHALTVLPAAVDRLRRVGS